MFIKMAARRKNKAKLFRYKDRVYHMFLRSYLVIMLIPLLLSMAAYGVMVDYTLDSEREKTRYALNQIAMTMDKELAILDTYMSQILNDHELSALAQMNSPYQEGQSIIQTLNLQRTLKRYYIDSSILEELLIYLQKPNLLFTRVGEAFFDPMDYFQNSLKLEDERAQRLLEVIRQPGRARIWPAQAISNQDERLALYIQPFQMEGAHKGNMVALIRASGFYDILSNYLDIEPGCSIWLENSAGEVVFSYGQYEPGMENRADVLAERVDSALSGCSYGLVLPNSIVLANAYTYLKFVVICLSAALAAGIGLAYFYAQRQGRPLDNIRANLMALYLPGAPLGSERGGEIRRMDERIQSLIVSHKRNEEYLNLQTGLAQRLFFEKLCAGLFDQQHQIEEMLRQLKRPLLNPPIAVALFSAAEDGRQDLSLYEAGLFANSLAQCVEEMVDGPFYLYESSMSVSVLILECNSGGMSEVEQKIGRLAGALDQRVKRESNLSTHCVLGEATSLLDVGRVFTACGERLRRMKEGETLLLLRTLAPNSRFFYPLEEESRLISFTLSGNGERALKILSDLFEVNFGEQADQAANGRMMAAGLSGTLVRLRDELNGEEDLIRRLDEGLGRLESRCTPQELFTTVSGCIEQIAGRIQMRRQGKTREKMLSVQAYMRQHFDDPEMGLAALARKFDLTEAYLSSAFKECLGINLSSFLERLRMERAMELMKEDMTLEQIAQQVGYSSVYSFRGAFKRTTGLPPSAYRDQMKREEQTGSI